MANPKKTWKAVKARREEVRLGIKECRNGNASGFQLIATTYPADIGVTPAEFKKWRTAWERLQRKAHIKKGTAGTLVYAHEGMEYGVVCGLHETDNTQVHVQFMGESGLELRKIDELDTQETCSPKTQWEPPEEVLAMAAY